MFVTSYSVTYCIYVPGKLGICLHHYCAVYDECKYSDTFWLSDRTRLFLKLQNSCQIYFVECVSKMKHILSVIHYTMCGAVCFQFTHSLVMIERIYILCLIIIIKSEVWTITHCLGLVHETMVSAVCLSIFLPKLITMQLWCIVPREFRFKYFDILAKTLNCLSAFVQHKLIGSF